MKGIVVNLGLFWILVTFSASCTYTDINKKADCATSTLAVNLVSKSDPIGCNAIDGKLVVNASGGKAPYDYSLNGGAYQTKNEFLNLSAGSYSIKAKDANNCDRSIQVELVSPNSTLSATTIVGSNNQCNQPNGSVTISGTGGKSPYIYLFGSGAFSSTNVFTSLKHGIYNAIVKDANDCQQAISITIPRGATGVSYANEISPILTVTCNLPSCHDAGSGGRNWTTYDNVKANATNIKTRTGNKSMPIGSGPTLTQKQIDLIACWADDGAPNN
jgi:hypothetical protein